LEDPIMRRSYCTITPATVRTTAAAGLQRACPWHDVGSVVQVGPLLDLILLTAALGLTLSAVLRRFAFGFCYETARQALEANLPPLDRLEHGLVDALHGYLPRSIRRRGWDIAVDLHDVPFSGDPKTKGLLGGPKKAGTNRFFVYATAVIVDRGQRWCLALTAVPNTRWEEATGRLAEQLEARGLRVRCLILDRGFFSGHVILALQQRRWPFVVGISRKGGRINRLFEEPVGQVNVHRWKTERGSRPVEASVILARRRVKGHWRRELYAFEGIHPEGAVRRYQRARYSQRLMRRRFGIETSYRQMRQGQGKTTSRDPRPRLLWLGVALLLRQVWQWLQQRLTPRGTRWSSWRVHREWPLARLLDWLAQSLRHVHPEELSLPLPRPMQLPNAKPPTR
jgi:hypothetical protein